MAFENDNTIQKKKQVNSELKILTTKFCEKGQEMVVYSLFAIVKSTFFRLIRMTALPNKNIY